MSLYEQVEHDISDARRRSDQAALDALGLLKSEVVKASKEPGFKGALDDELVRSIVGKEIKRRNESAEAYRGAGRQEAAERESALAAILARYLPAQLSAQELEAEVDALIAEIAPSGPGAFGQVMKEASKRFSGRADGATVAATVRRRLG